MSSAICESTSGSGIPQGEILKNELQELVSRWCDIPVLLEERIKKLDQGIITVEKFYEGERWLSAWLLEIEKLLVSLNVEEIQDEEAKLTKFDDTTVVAEGNSLEDNAALLNKTVKDMDAYKERVAAIEMDAHQIIENAEKSFSSEISYKLDELMKRWKMVEQRAKESYNKIETYIQKREKVLEMVDELTKWLRGLEEELPPKMPINSSAELFQLKAKFQDFKERVDGRTQEFRDVNETGNDLILSFCGKGESVQNMARKFTQLNAKWTEVTDQIYARSKFLKEASHQYGEFRALVAQEMDWLDKLERRLRKSPKSAADAEEISEELDDLENYMRNHPEARLARIQEIGRMLVEGEVTAQSVASDVDTLTNRWSTLSQQ
ncbi:hypothetical protein J437_LFUL015547, partial [Ladona fulva]